MRDTRQSYMENGLGAGLEISEFQSFKVELDRSVERGNRRNGDVGGLVGESAKRRRRSSESEEGASERGPLLPSFPSVQSFATQTAVLISLLEPDAAD